LVEREITAGREFTELIMKDKLLRVEASFWWKEDDDWRFIVATPIVHERGLSLLIEKLRKCLETR